jgi:hypothetical protein
VWSCHLWNISDDICSSGIVVWQSTQGGFRLLNREEEEYVKPSAGADFANPHSQAVTSHEIMETDSKEKA